MITSISPLASWFLGEWQLKRQIFSLPHILDNSSELSYGEKNCSNLHGLVTSQILERFTHLNLQPLFLIGSARFVDIAHACEKHINENTNTSFNANSTPNSHKSHTHQSLLHFHEELKYPDNPAIKATQDYIYCFTQNLSTNIDTKKASLTICFPPNSWLNSNSLNAISSLKPFCSFDFLRLLGGMKTYATPHLCGQDYYYATLKLFKPSNKQSKIADSRFNAAFNNNFKRFNLEVYVRGPKKHYIAISEFTHT